MKEDTLLALRPFKPCCSVAGERECRAVISMNRPTTSTVEAVLSHLDTIPIGESKPFQLSIPQHLTLRDQPVSADVAMAIILDNIFGMGYEPDGFMEADGGRVYRYKVMT
jgi:hypothetical protein